MYEQFRLRTLAPALLLLVLAPRALASNTWFVDGVNGNDSNDCKSPQTACKTIGHAISLASSGDSIQVAPAKYTENLTIGFSLRLIGSDAKTTILDGSRSGSVIYIPPNNDQVELSKMTIRNGKSPLGGGIENEATLTIEDSRITRNVARGEYDDWGGGIANYGTLMINRSTIDHNHVIGGGYPGFGGGIYNRGTLTLKNSTVSANSGGLGGGIEDVGTTTIANSTISENVAHSEGGGIDCADTQISNSTISGNRAPRNGGGAIFVFAQTPTLRDTILANSPLGGNCSAVNGGRIISDGYNLSSDNSCKFDRPGDMNNTDPNLGRLRNNGGPTKTHALLEGSPAIDAGNPSGCRDSKGRLLKTDQRGKRRPDHEDSSGCDMGAYERQKD